MFSSIGWGEIFVILIFGFIIVGPERLPELMKDVRAAIYAARKAINNAKQELEGSLGDELTEPISKVAQMRKMTPQGMLSKALFEEDETFLDDLNPSTMLKGQGTPSQFLKGESPRSTAARGSTSHGSGAHSSGSGGGKHGEGKHGEVKPGAAASGQEASNPSGNTASGAVGYEASGGGAPSRSTTSYSDPTHGWDDIT